MALSKTMLPYALSLFMLVAAVFAECNSHSFTSCADGIVHWYDPNTGEVCDPLDCGGGRAPPKTNVPGCPLYTGTAIRTTSYLSCWTPLVAAPATIASVSATSTTVSVSATSATAPSLASSATSTTVLVSATSATTAPSLASSATSTGGSVSAPSTTVSAASSTETTTVPGTITSEASTSVPSTTAAPSISSAAGNNGTQSTSGAAVPPKTTGSNDGNLLHGSLMAVAGAAIGAFVLI